MTAYDLTKLPQRASESASDGEHEQSAAAYELLFEQHLKPATASLLAPIFELGFVSGVRFGHTGMALAGVPLPPGDVAVALGPLAWRLADINPGDMVLYHGTLTELHGQHRVSQITRGRTETRYHLERLEYGAWVSSVHNARRRSITPQR
ncbi:MULTISPECIES: hypothetical protein [Streptomyces]|uniref:Uncharacterized protein n=1 Tax=Streptomyces odorifer TaxID=53450 RepID=A0A7Y6CE00_9ACTN|nr:hypothetical protein [Streptomyces odorifer]NUV30893.1 hypothetical protein [Streptomyces odorifer]NUV32905.1 hypothetical protein [Streptomyces sp. KAI-27]NUV45782.1 hypothetical protein [Streptomyces sp. CAI-78]